jgi:type I restriction enzyme S subunit
LEEQAKALFKSWFIDFEPFKGGKFVDSELGMIPEGWEACPLELLGKLPKYCSFVTPLFQVTFYSIF